MHLLLRLYGDCKRLRRSRCASRESRKVASLNGKRLSIHVYIKHLGIAGYSLIRSLRAAVPEESQVGWQPFCHRWAVPLLDRLEGYTDRPLRENEIRITRARYDRAIKIGLPLAVAIMIPLAILLTQPAFAFFPIFIVFFMGVLANVRSKDGYDREKSD
jgi:hypothetical protein